MFLKKISWEKVSINICLVSIFVFALGMFLQAEKDSDKVGQSEIKAGNKDFSIPQPLTYGSFIYIKNGYNNWNGGFLDVRGNNCEGNYRCVSTAIVEDRDNGSGTWKIISASGKAEGTPVAALDIIHLKNQWNNGNGGYLDICGAGCEGNTFCVSTATTSNRNNGSGTWKIIPDLRIYDCKIYEDQPVRLLNGYNGFRGGFLDTCGAGCEGNLYCVSTYLGWNRNNGLITTTCWKMLIVPPPHPE